MKETRLFLENLNLFQVTPKLYLVSECLFLIYAHIFSAISWREHVTLNTLMFMVPLYSLFGDSENRKKKFLKNQRVVTFSF